MPAMPQKIRTGLVELRTNLGSVYISPAFWERIYLLWTFRNFHCLPRQVLNRREQQLIDKLSQAETVSRTAPIARSAIIGVVENVHLKQDWATEKAETPGMLIEMSAASADTAPPRATGSEGIGVRLRRYPRTGFGRLRKPSGNVQNISAPQPDFAGQAEPDAEPDQASSVRISAGRTWSRNKLGWALVAACGAALLGILFYFREGRPASSIHVSQVATQAHKPASASVFPAVARPNNVPQSLPTEVRPPATVSPSRAGSSPEGKNRKTAIVAELPTPAAQRTPEPQPTRDKQPTPTLQTAPVERLQVTEMPNSGFSYPMAPAPTLTGKVVLKAVIGTDGTVKEVEVLSGNPALAAAASRVVQHWRYRPHQLGGQPVEAETNITISFVGDDAVSISFPAAH